MAGYDLPYTRAAASRVAVPNPKAGLDARFDTACGPNEGGWEYLGPALHVGCQNENLSREPAPTLWALLLAFRPSATLEQGRVGTGRRTQPRAQGSHSDAQLDKRADERHRGKPASQARATVGHTQQRSHSPSEHGRLCV